MNIRTLDTGANLVRSVRTEHETIQGILNLLSSVMIFVTERKGYPTVIYSLSITLKARLDYEESKVFPQIARRGPR